MMCLDEWQGRDSWPEIRKTVKMMRQLQPQLMIRNRGIGNYGDYYQPEQVIPSRKENTNMPWMSICLLGKFFSYDPNGKNYKGSPWIIRNLIECVSKGGSFMVCIGPDAKGNFHPVAVKQLEEVGNWLKVNSRGIYETRGRVRWSEDIGNDKKNRVHYTRTKDGKKEFAFIQKWPGRELVLKKMSPKPGSVVRMLGVEEPLKWVPLSNDSMKIEIPEKLQDPANRPCQHAWGFEFITIHG